MIPTWMIKELERLRRERDERERPQLWIEPPEPPPREPPPPRPAPCGPIVIEFGAAHDHDLGLQVNADGAGTAGSVEEAPCAG